jgi:acyl-CoA synthetase (NDP forming)
MKNFVEPESVALIGVSRSAAPISGLKLDILGHLLDYGYKGRIYPVNPHAGEILGIKAYHSIGEVAGAIDLAVINLPRSLVPGATRECVERGISAITIVTQGFADANDAEGQQLQTEIDEIIKGKARVLGPNTFGTANAFINFSSSFVKMTMKLVPIGLICQSGVFMLGYTDLALVGKGIDLGNGCDVDFADALGYFEQDNDVRVVAPHIEGMRDTGRFLRVANRVAHKKPMVALKTGRSGLAAEAAQSHTGSLVGKDEVWEVALKQSGITRVTNIDELGDMVKVFCTLLL